MSLIENSKAVICDLDGVLIDGMPFHCRAWAGAFESFGIRIEEEDIYLREGEKRQVTANELYEKYTGRAADPTLAEVIIEEKDRIYRTIFRVRFIPGALEMLAVLKQKGVKAGLVTGSTSLHEMFSRHGDFLTLFDAIVDGEATPKGKPWPDPYLAAVERLRLPADQCCVIENAPLGIRSAIAAKLTCYAVKGPSPLSLEILKAAGAHFTFDDLTELLDSLRRSDCP
jgi:HAD superfamily hydrolase (TIGR01509 family)